MMCPQCQTENRPGRKFCSNCGSGLALACPTCGASNEPSDAFCGECGTGLAGAPAATASVEPPGPGQATERRLVTVLFADLVGFTPLSEQRDPEEVREFLTEYFDRSREIIERFGGQIDKFIGDAVMAVWGADRALEDDAERSVRAALELVDAVAKQGAETGTPELSLRVGVLTGEASVGPGANVFGLVVGDMVNTASRLQSLAPAGSVLVGASTKTLSETSIDYEDAGEHQVKGREAPVAAFRALRVASMRGGAGKRSFVEGPFVGRSDELRMLKGLLHSTERDGRARLALISGEAGIGKSRLVSELKNYADGLVSELRWHEGRSPAYDQGVTFWSLNEMVRSRADIAETDDAETARTKLSATVDRVVPSQEDRLWIGPKLEALLGLAGAPPSEKDELFAALRAFFEHLSAEATVLLIFDDLQWADDGLLEFFRDLPRASHRHPILTIGIARPDLLRARPGWLDGQPNTIGLHVGPFDDIDMETLVRGLDPSMDDALVASIVERSGGIPLYAVELARMAPDVSPDDAETSLTVPDSLAALLSARLDAVTPEDRDLLMRGAALGLSFTVEGLAAVTGRSPDDLTGQLSSLENSQLLELNRDPRSPERGQYRFVQALIREVAYGRTSRADRRVVHERAATYLASQDDLVLAPVVASHYLAAYQAEAGGRDSERLMHLAVGALSDAASRAAGLHSHRQALAYLEQAIEIAPDHHAVFELVERAGRSAELCGEHEAATAHLARAFHHYETLEDLPAASRLMAARVHALLRSRGDVAEAVGIAEEFIDGHPALDTPEFVSVLRELAHAQMRSLDSKAAAATAERALIRAEALDLRTDVAEALNTRGTSLASLGRYHEGMALLRGSLAVAEAENLIDAQLRALVNLEYVSFFHRLRHTDEVDHLIALAEKHGSTDLLYGNILAGARGSATLAFEWDRYDELTARVTNNPEMTKTHQVEHDMLSVVAATERGVEGGGRDAFEALTVRLPATTDPQAVATVGLLGSRIAFAEGDLETAAVHHSYYPAQNLTSITASLLIGSHDLIDPVAELVDHAPSMGHGAINLVKVYLEAGLAALEKRSDAEQLFDQATAHATELGTPRVIGYILLVRSALLGDDEAGEEARTLFTEHGAPALAALADVAIARRR